MSLKTQKGARFQQENRQRLSEPSDLAVCHAGSSGLSGSRPRQVALHSCSHVVGIFSFRIRQGNILSTGTSRILLL